MFTIKRQNLSGGLVYKQQSEILRDIIEPNWRKEEKERHEHFMKFFDCNQSERHILATRLECIYIDNHPDRRASGWDDERLIQWGVDMGLISQEEAEAY